MAIDLHEQRFRLALALPIYLQSAPDNYSNLMGDCASRGAQQEPDCREIERQEEEILATAISEVKKKRHRGKKAMTEDEVYQLLSEYFDTFDTDRDGVLAYNEILQMLRQIETNVNKKRKHKIEFDLSEAKAFFAKIDKNGDNYINKEQFYRYYKSL